LWPISPVTLTEFLWSHAQQKRHHLSPLKRLMSRENTVNVSLHFGQETAIFLLLFWYICSSAALECADSSVTLAAHCEKSNGVLFRYFLAGNEGGSM
jgi:hypothetical protein